MDSDIRSFSDQVAIKQDGPDEPLIFEYDKSDKKIKSSHTIKNSKLISLQSALGEDDTFRTSFKIEYVKPISSAVLSENIEIYADENKPMMFIIQMDDRAIEMRILTNIIDDRERDIDI
jgi:flagellar hook assembly protein FlgD